MHVLIAGAGIAGLTTALSLHAAGIDAEVIDSAARLRPLGVGINLQPHAIRELTELGLGDELAATGIETAEQSHFDRHGGLIWREPRGRGLGYNWPQYSIHRGELQMILLAAVHARLGKDAVREGTILDRFSDCPDGVRAFVRDRAAGTAGELRADALIGADGLYSAVRAQLHPGEGEPRWSGVTMWRGITEGEQFLSGATVAVAGSNTAAKFVAYPVGRGPAGAVRINWVAEVLTGSPGTPLGHADWNRAGRLADALPWFGGWRFGWLDVPALMARTDEVLEYPMVDRDPLPFWGRGRVTLAGDAAHPMYPIGSNGGSQAIVDARVLAASLASCGQDPADGLAAYEAARREVANAIVLANREMPADQVLHEVATRAPGGFGRIEDVLTADELDRITGAYQRTTSQDVAALNSRPPLV